MNLQYLKYAIEVERAGSISKAAQKLYMNQPNLSKAIKELELIVGVPLFKRSTKGISATTEEGRVFIEYAKSILSQFEDMKSHLNAPKKNELRVAIPRASYIAEAFASFIGLLGKSEEFHISFQETNSLKAIKRVSDEGYDIGVIRYRTRFERYFISLLNESGLDYEELLCSNSVVAMGENNRLAKREELEAADLADMTEVVNDDFTLPDKLPHLPSDDGLRDEAPTRKRIFVYERGSQFDILSRIPDTFMWVSPLPQNVLRRNSLIQKRCRVEDSSFKDMLIYQRGHVFGELERMFLDKLNEEKTALMPAD